MMSPISKQLWVTVLLFLPLGCKGRVERSVEISGQVISGEKPLRVKGGEELKVLFCSVNSENKPTEKSYLATADRRGHFTVSVAPGKYRIAVRLLHRDRDLLHNAFDSIKSPFVREIHEGDSLTLDLDHPTH